MHAALFEAVHSGSHQNITKVAYEILKRPLFISDSQCRPVDLYPKAPIGDEIWDRNLTLEVMDLDFFMQHQKYDVINIFRSAREPVLIPGDAGRASTMTVGVFVDGIFKGALSVYCPKGDSDNFYTENIENLKNVAKAYSIYFRYKNVDPADVRAMHTPFLTALHNDEIKDIRHLEFCMSKISFDFHADYCILAMKPGHFSSLLDKHLQELSVIQPLFMFVSIDTISYILVTRVTEKRIQNNSIIRGLLAASEKLNLSIGASRRFFSLFHSSDFFYQARRALELSSEQGEPAVLRQYEDYAVQDISKCFEGHKYTRAMIHPALFLLEEYDVSNNTEYLKTIYYYIHSFCNATNVNNRLCTHRNTLFYRLKRIEELTEINLHDEKTCIHLLLSFQIQHNWKGLDTIPST